jgi:lysophospholipase L1-like esterase
MRKRNNVQLNRLSSPATVTRLYLFCCFFALAGIPLHAQRIDFTYETYGLESDRDNVIQNAIHLEDFFESLYQQKITNDRKINIVHIGDSHIQADYLSSIVRRNFHRHFGNAGRGLIVPLKVAGTNEPNNYKTVSSGKWISKRCVFPEEPLPIGVGGVTIGTNQADASFEILMNDLWLDYTFNRLTLFYAKDTQSFDFTVTDKNGNLLGKIDPLLEGPSLDQSQLTWEKNIDGLKIQAIRKNAEQRRAIIYGAVLENLFNGVLYHTIGVNGAKFMHYNAARYFTDQVTALKPDIFIISLGTNEAIDYPYLDKNFPSQIDKLVSTLRTNNPMAKFILVTPQDSFQRKTKINPGIMTIREQIIEYAVENGLAFYDMYRAMGGENSAKAWSKSTLLTADGVHLSRNGYEYQGNLFYHAIMKSYNLYVPTRHQ